MIGLIVTNVIIFCAVFWAVRRNKKETARIKRLEAIEKGSSSMLHDAVEVVVKHEYQLEAIKWYQEGKDPSYFEYIDRAEKKAKKELNRKPKT